MRILPFKLKVALLVLGAAVSTVGSLLAQASAPETNGITAAVQVSQPIPGTGPQHFIEINVRLRFENEADIERRDHIVEGLKLNGTNWDSMVLIHQDPSSNWVYFMATNSFPGPVELRDSSGEKVPLLKPHLNSPEAYPPSFSLSAMHRVLMGRIRGHWDGLPPWFPKPLVPDKDTTATMPGQFALEDYCDIKKPGRYVLTIWPKIYKRVTKGADICQRIDVPPVAVSFNWP